MDDQVYERRVAEAQAMCDQIKAAVRKQEDAAAALTAATVEIAQVRSLLISRYADLEDEIRKRHPEYD